MARYEVSKSSKRSTCAPLTIHLVNTLNWWRCNLSFICLCITKTCLYNFDPFKPHFYIVKLGFTGVCIIFLISAQKIDCWYSLEPPRHNEKYGKYQSFLSENFQFSEVKFSIYLNRRVFIMVCTGTFRRTTFLEFCATSFKITDGIANRADPDQIGPQMTAVQSFHLRGRDKAGIINQIMD